jgi:adenine-specific DNA-methyltransferase
MPVVSKAKHLRSPFLTEEEWNNLKTSGERIWLFNPTEVLAKNDLNVSRYLKLALPEGGCNREAYKVSIREPWYCTPMPRAPDAFLSGMNQEGPWLCINETKKVNATNTLYIVRFASRDRKDWYMWALALLTSEARRQIRRIGRRYPDGLVKYEPGSLNRIELPRPRTDVDHKSLYIKAVAALRAGKVALTKNIADFALD